MPFNDHGTFSQMPDSTSVAAKEPQIATLGGGCFWCLEAVFDQMKGVSSVESGYMGGRRPDPTYEQVCTGVTGHIEVVRISFDPDIAGYRDLLQVFFAIHDPTAKDRQGNDVGEQYRSVIFYHSEEQRTIAEQVIREIAGEFPDPVVTELRPAETFWRAESYHQEYLENNPGQPYCMFVVGPKVEKFRKYFATLKK
jgi:peptide-methionine (S)-S-oxide reductase